MRKFFWVVASAAFLACSMRVSAEDCAAPCIGYEISAELSNDWIFAADPSSLKSDVLQPTITGDVYVMPTDFLKFQTSIVTESVIDVEPGKSAVFKDIGTYVGELSATLELEPLSITVGKFDTTFSLASEQLPGLNSTDLASAFDADERWGAEAAFAFGAMGFNHVVAATAFTTDRSFLSESLFTNRGRTRISDGGAGNTSGVSSFSATFTGCKDADPADCYDDGAFGYRIGLRHQRAGRPTEDQIADGLNAHAEDALLAASLAKFELAEDSALHLLGEAAYIRHFEGDANDALLLTASSALDIGQMRYIVTYTMQQNLIAGEPDTHDHLLDVEAIYASEEGTPIQGSSWELGVAYTFAKNADEENANILSLRGTLNFAGNAKLRK